MTDEKRPAGEFFEVSVVNSSVVIEWPSAGSGEELRVTLPPSIAADLAPLFRYLRPSHRDLATLIERAALKAGDEFSDKELAEMFGEGDTFEIEP